ncbi:MAG: virulence RhuM family protein [Peptococcaceae bacterium]|jgi:hypothetical protein|nr:virulence RhuM family protein [Peptococcaceae bacterium]
MSKERTSAKQNKANMVIYQTADGLAKIDVRLMDDNLWLNQAQLVELFQTSKQNISLHIKNVFAEEELGEKAVVKEYLTTASDGKNYRVKYYNLDMIIAIGYRVKSSRGTQFRQWATPVLHEYLQKGFSINTPKLKEAGGGNYWKELFRLNRLISAFFDLAEIRASEHVPMHMKDWLIEIDRFTDMYGKGTLTDSGSVSHKNAVKKAEKEYAKFQVRELSAVEGEYLNALKEMEKQLNKIIDTSNGKLP